MRRLLFAVLLLALATAAYAECKTIQPTVAWFDIERVRFILKQVGNKLLYESAPTLSGPNMNASSLENREARFAQLLAEAAKQDIRHGIAYTIPKGTIVKVVGASSREVSQIEIKGHRVYVEGEPFDCK